MFDVVGAAAGFHRISTNLACERPKRSDLRAGGGQIRSGIVRVLRLSDVEPGVSQFLSNHHADQRITLDDQYLCRYRFGLGLGSMEFPS